MQSSDLIKPQRKSDCSCASWRHLAP